MLTPYNKDYGQTIISDVPGVDEDRAFISHIVIAADLATVASNTSVHAAVTLGDAAQDVTTGITNPSVPRSVIIKGNAAGIAGNVTIEGTNYAGEAISETLALNGATAVEGAKAFKTVTKITLPAKTNSSGDTVSIGTGEKLGIPYKLAHNTVLFATLDNTREGTAPTVAVSATSIESNTVDLSSALSSKEVDIYLVV